MVEIWWPLSGGYRESVATTLPTPVSYYVNEAALMKHNDMMTAAIEKEQQKEKKRLQIQQEEKKLLQLQQRERLNFILQDRWTTPLCERPRPKMIDDSEKKQQEHKQKKQQENKKRTQRQQDEALNDILQARWPKPLCERPRPKMR